MRNTSFFIAILILIQSVSTVAFVQEKEGVKLEIEDYAHGAKRDQIIVANHTPTHFNSRNQHAIKIKIINNSTKALILSPHSISLEQYPIKDLLWAGHSIKAVLGGMASINTLVLSAGVAGMLLYEGFFENKKLINKGYHVDPSDSRRMLRDKGKNAIEKGYIGFRLENSVYYPTLASFLLLGFGSIKFLSYLEKQATKKLSSLFLTDELIIQPGDTIERFIFVNIAEYNKEEFSVCLTNAKKFNDEFVFTVPWGI